MCNQNNLRMFNFMRLNCPAGSNINDLELFGIQNAGNSSSNECSQQGSNTTKLNDLDQ